MKTIKFYVSALSLSTEIAKQFTLILHINLTQATWEPEWDALSVPDKYKIGEWALRKGGQERKKSNKENWGFKAGWGKKWSMLEREVDIFNLMICIKYGHRLALCFSAHEDVVNISAGKRGGVIKERQGCSSRHSPKPFIAWKPPYPHQSACQGPEGNAEPHKAYS